MNAIAQPPAPTSTDRKSRHLAVCEELIDLGMQLARAAAAHALDVWQATPIPTPAANPPTTQEQPPTAKAPDANLAFARLSRSVRQSVALEAQIAADAFTRTRPQQTDHERSEENFQEIAEILERTALSKALEHMVQTHPNRWHLHPIINETLDRSVADYPDDPLATHVTRACEAIGIEPDLTCLPPFLAAQIRGDPWPWPTQ